MEKIQQEELKEKIKTISNELEEIKKESAENWELFVRTKAEFENFKKKIDKNINNEIKNSNKKIFIDLLPVLDSIESCINNEKIKANHTGMFLLYKMLIKILKNNEIEKIKIKKYEEFDPQKHEVISVIKSTIYDNKIFSVFQSGYKFQNQIIRYSKVCIFKKE